MLCFEEFPFAVDCKGKCIKLTFSTERSVGENEFFGIQCRKIDIYLLFIINKQ